MVRKYSSYLLHYILGERIPWSGQRADQCLPKTVTGSADSLLQFAYVEDLFAKSQFVEVNFYF